MKSDPTILRALVGLGILFALFFIIERCLARGRPQPFLRGGWLTDVIYWFATLLIIKPFAKVVSFLPVVLLVMAGATTWAVLKTGSYHGYGPLSRQPLWLQVVEIYALVDLCGYWTHRLFHCGRWWPFHAVHHSSEDLDWLGSLRVHPVNDMVNKFMQASPVLLLGLDPCSRLRPRLCLPSTPSFCTPMWTGISARGARSLQLLSFIGGTIQGTGRLGTKISPGCCPFGTFCSAPTTCQKAGSLKTLASMSPCPPVFRPDVGAVCLVTATRQKSKFKVSDGGEPSPPRA
ncbi:MAG: Fatty acid hydroxylase superfamily protein [Verrucomicrobiaceae bacterium]|nr:Fatty acid hydroxylase superfamily protein [Verrucomicrobiaceae bacterium]